MNVRIGNHLVSVHKWTILFETLTNDSLALLLFAKEGSSGLLGQPLKDISMRFMWHKVLSKTNQYIQVEHSDSITLTAKAPARHRYVVSSSPWVQMPKGLNVPETRL